MKYFNSEYPKGGQEHFNADKKSKFASKLIEKLQQISKLSPNDNFADRDQNIEELVKAFKNLVMHMDLVIEKDDFNRYFETLCELIKLEDNLQDMNQQIPQPEQNRLKKLSGHVLDIIKHIVQKYQANQYNNVFNQRQDFQDGGNILQKAGVFIDGSNHCEYLLDCDPFKKLMIRVMYLREIEIVEFKKDVIEILKDIINMPEFVTKLFIDKGLIMFVLNLIFDFKYKHVIDKEIRGKLTHQVLKIEHA